MRGGFQIRVGFVVPVLAVKVGATLAVNCLFGGLKIYQPTFGMEVTDCLGRTRRPEATAIGVLLALGAEAVADGVMGGSAIT